MSFQATPGTTGPQEPTFGFSGGFIVTTGDVSERP